MQKAEHFMRDFFIARIAEEKKYQAVRASFRSKFFTEQIRFESHADTLRRMGSEKVVTIKNDGKDCIVVTEQTVSVQGNFRKMRLKYDLHCLDDQWLIRDVRTACLACEGRGDEDCPLCKGNPWVAAR